MIEHEFYTYKEMLEFIEDRRDDKRACYYWGFIENLNGELYSIVELEKEAEPDWFEDGATSTVYEFEIDPIYAVIIERKGDDEVIICNNKQHAMEEAEKEWDRLTSSEKNKYVVRGVVRYIDYYKDTRTLIDEFYFDADEVDMENLTEKQKEIIVSGIYDEEIWNSSEWEQAEVDVKDAWGNWHTAYINIEDALDAYDERNSFDDEDEEDDEEWLSLGVFEDNYGRRWYAVGDMGQFSDCQRRNVKEIAKNPYKWPEELIEKVKL